MQSEQVNDHEVASDGRSVWVNNKTHCVARFSKRTMEFNGVDGINSVAVSKPSTAWTEFKNIVKNTVGVVVTDSHRPIWVA